MGRVLVTGASGFIGSAVARALAAGGHTVRALVEPGRDHSLLDGLAIERVTTDIRDPAAVERAVTGIDTVFHLAAVYRFWAADPAIFYDVNIGGTVNLIRAMNSVGSARLVYTSTVATLGVAEDGQLASEHTLAHFEHLFGHYKRSKYQAEHEVLRAGAPVSMSCSCIRRFPSGKATPRRHRPAARSSSSSTDAFLPTSILRSTSSMSTTSRVVICSPHSSARRGRSYILGGENMSLREMLTVLAELCGLPAPRVRLAPRAVLPLVQSAEWFEASLLHREPTLTSEPVRMATTKMEYDTTPGACRARVHEHPGAGSFAARGGVVRHERIRQAGPGCEDRTSRFAGNTRDRARRPAPSRRPLRGAAS